MNCCIQIRTVLLPRLILQTRGLRLYCCFQLEMAYTYGTYGVNSFGQKTVLFFCFEGETRQNSTSVMCGQVVELLEDMQEEMSKEEEKDQETHDKQVPRGATRCPRGATSAQVTTGTFQILSLWSPQHWSPARHVGATLTFLRRHLRPLPYMQYKDWQCHAVPEFDRQVSVAAFKMA